MVFFHIKQAWDKKYIVSLRFWETVPDSSWFCLFLGEKTIKLSGNDDSYGKIESKLIAHVNWDSLRIRIQEIKLNYEDKQL